MLRHETKKVAAFCLLAAMIRDPVPAIATDAGYDDRHAYGTGASEQQLLAAEKVEKIALLSGAWLITHKKLNKRA